VHGNETAVDQGAESHMSKQVKPNLERSHEMFTPDFILLFDPHGPWPLDYERIVAHPNELTEPAQYRFFAPQSLK